MKFVNKFLMGAALVTGLTCTGAIAKNLSYLENLANMSHGEVVVDVKTLGQAERYLTEFLKYKSDRENFGRSIHAKLSKNKMKILLPKYYPDNDEGYDFWDSEYVASFKKIHTNKSDDCDGGVVAAAALLSDNGYSPLYLGMSNKNSFRPGHAVFIYEESGKWGTLGINGGDCRAAEYISIENIIKDYGYNMMNESGRSYVNQILEEVREDFLINSSRMHLYGLSMGAMGAPVYVRHFPGVFASIACFAGSFNLTEFYPLSSGLVRAGYDASYGTPEEAPEVYANNSAMGNEKYFKDTPVMLVHGAADNTVPTNHSRNFNASLSALGYIVNYYEPLAADHFTFSTYMGDYDEIMYDFFTTYTLADRSAPYVTLQTANASSQSGTNATLICNSFDLYNNTNVTLYGDFNGTWAAVETNSSGIDQVNYTFTVNISSSGTYNWNCYACDNLSQCDFAAANYTLGFTYVSDEEEDSSSGGSGYVPKNNFWTGTTYVTTEEQFADGFTKLVKVKERFKLSVKMSGTGQTHYVGVKEIVNNSVLIVIESEPIEVRLKVGEYVKVDLINDSYYDLYVVLNDIVDDKADITIKEIHEKIPEEIRGLIETSGEIFIEEESPAIKNQTEVRLTWLLFYIIVVVIFVFLIILGIRELNNKKCRKKK